MTPAQGGTPLLPESASTLAPRVDALTCSLLVMTGFFVVVIAGAIGILAIRYRRRRPDERGEPPRERLWVEAVWTALPLGALLVFFTWGSALYVEARRPPAGARDVSVVARQWMWKFQHPDGRREINELHVPVGTAVRLTMASEDVIHSLYVPAFRVKQDVVPGSYQRLWFEATKAGSFRLYCAEYCGTAHASMIGRVVVMEPREFEAWLSGGAPGEPPEAAGERLARRLGCLTCHREDSTERGPRLRGLAGTRVTLSSGELVNADDDYLRESILDPAVRVTAGFTLEMPTYRGQLTEEDVMRLVAWIRSLR